MLTRAACRTRRVGVPASGASASLAPSPFTAGRVEALRACATAATGGAPSTLGVTLLAAGFMLGGAGVTLGELRAAGGIGVPLDGVGRNGARAVPCAGVGFDAGGVALDGGRAATDGGRTAGTLAVSAADFGSVADFGSATDFGSVADFVASADVAREAGVGVAVGLGGAAAGVAFGAGTGLGVELAARARELGGGGGVLARMARDSSKNGRSPSASLAPLPFDAGVRTGGLSVLRSVAASFSTRLFKLARVCASDSVRASSVPSPADSAAR